MDAAVVILTNAEYSDSTTELAKQLQELVGIKPPMPTQSEDIALSQPLTENAVEARARRLVEDLARGRVDNADFSPDALATFTPQAVSDIRHSLAPLGQLERVKLDETKLRGGTTHYALRLFFTHYTLQIAEYDLADGKIEQFLIDDKP